MILGLITYKYYMLLHIKIQHSVHEVHLCVSNGSHNKQQCYPHIALTALSV
jgi:hypothetical protein